MECYIALIKKIPSPALRGAFFMGIVYWILGIGYEGLEGS